MQHHMFKLVNEGQLFFAPLQNPKRILDIGTGSGIWPMEMGTHHLSPQHILNGLRSVIAPPPILFHMAKKSLDETSFLLSMTRAQHPSSQKPKLQEQTYHPSSPQKFPRMSTSSLTMPPSLTGYGTMITSISSALPT